MSRIKGLAHLIMLVLLEAAGFLALRTAGQVERWRVDWSDPLRWIDQAPPTDVAIAGLRWVGLVAVAYLGITTMLYLLAALTRLPGLMRATGLLTLPGVRRIVEGGMAVSIMASAVLTRAPLAMAQEPVSGWTSTPVATATAVSSPAVAVVSPDAPTPPAVVPTVADAGAWEVASGDNYWDIAAATLARVKGVPVGQLRSAEITPYWLELMQRSSVAGGNRSGDPNLIFPGEHQVLPPTASYVQTDAPEPAPDDAPQIGTVGPPSAPPGPPASTPVPPPAPPAPPTTAPEAAPVPDAPATTATPAQAPTDVPGAPAEGDEPPAEGDEPAQSFDVHKTASDTGFPVLPIGLLGAGLLCAGIGREVLKRRRRPERQRMPGEVFQPLSPEAELTELAVQVGADEILAETLDLALRAFAGATLYLEEGVEIVPLGVEVGPDYIDVLLAEPVDIPADQPPLTQLPGGRGWRVHTSPDYYGELEGLADGAPMALPALVSLGRTAAGSQVLLDLEEAMAVSVTGDGASELVTAAALQLGLPALSDRAAVVMVGFEDAPPVAGVRAVPSLEAVLDELAARAAQTAELVKASGCGSTFEARLVADEEVEGQPGLRRIEDGEPLIPTVVVCATAQPAHLVAKLLDLVSTDQALGVCALIAGEVPNVPWTLSIGPAGMVVDQLGLAVVQPQAITGPMSAGITELLEAAAAEPVPGPAAVAPTGPRPGRPEMLVRVLGQVRVEGPAGPVVIPHSSKCVEALVALAVNRERHVDKDLLITWLWPRSENAKASGKTLDNHLWHVRQATGYSPTTTGDDGAPAAYVPALEGGEYIYRLGGPELIDSDLALLRDAYLRSTSAPLEEARAMLHRELALVEGEPFRHATKGYEWTAPLARQARELCVDAAHRLFGLALDAGDFEQAAWAIARGLLASPGLELLYRDRIRLQAAQGESSDAIRATVGELLEFVDDDEEPALDPATSALVDQLTAVG